MGQTRVKAGHIELVQGSKYTKNMWNGCSGYVHETKDDQIDRRAFFPSGSFVFLQSSITFVFIAYFQAKKIIVNSLYHIN